MQAYLINADSRTIEPFEYQSGVDFRRHLPGGLCIGWIFPNGDVLYVDDEGLLAPAVRAFRVLARPDGQPMMSHGVLTGRDHGDDTLPPAMTTIELAREIAWLDLADALAWFRAKSHEPAVSITDHAGSVKVVADWRDMLDNLEGRSGYDPTQTAEKI